MLHFCKPQNVKFYYSTKSCIDKTKIEAYVLYLRLKSQLNQISFYSSEQIQLS